MAWVSTVHVPDDGNGEGFGMAHYTLAHDHRFVARNGSRTCTYGPSAECEIDTRRPFHVALEFTADPDPFGYTVTLEQGSDAAGVEAGTAAGSTGGFVGAGRSSVVGPVQYRSPPTLGSAGSAEAANADLRKRLDAGMTLVVSYWSTPEKKGMAWLDSPCRKDEQEAWGCSDAWTEHPEWPWICDAEDTARPTCSEAFTLTNLRLHAPPPPPSAPPPPPAPLTYERGVAVGFGSATILAALLLAVYVASRLRSALRGRGLLSTAPLERAQQVPSKGSGAGGMSSGSASGRAARANATDAADASPLMAATDREGASPRGRGDSVIRVSEDGELDMELPAVVTLQGKRRATPAVHDGDFEYF